MRSYTVTIDYRVPGILERPIEQHQPMVRVIEPVLKGRARDREGWLPHVYGDGTGCPPLCLFDFEAREWTPWHLLAETTVPWTADWLACYEGWRATGRWTGGGHHPTALNPTEAHS
jgi:hypothetical protein